MMLKWGKRRERERETPKSNEQFNLLYFRSYILPHQIYKINFQYKDNKSSVELKELLLSDK